MSDFPANPSTTEEDRISPMSTNESFTKEYTSYTATEKTNHLFQKEEFLETLISANLNFYVFPVILLIGLPGNVISFIVLVFSSLRRNTTSVYLAVISVLDTTILGGGIFFYVNSEFPNLGILTDISCKVINVCFYVCIHYNVLLIVAVTAERFVVVVFPLKAQLWISMRRTVVVIVCCGVFAFGLNLCHAFIRMARFSNATGTSGCCKKIQNVISEIVMQLNTD